MTEPSARIVSLDALRGITIAGMLIVNNQGDWAHLYAPVRHAPWHGLSPADLVFPFFLFIVGVSVAVAYSAGPVTAIARAGLFRKIVMRTLVLMALGLALNLPPDGNFAAMRIPGVLQRIAVCYFIAATSFVYAGRNTRYALFAGLLALYWALVELVPVPGHGAGALDAEGNLCRFIDASVFGAHTYAHSPAAGFDPEGLLSTLPAAATALAGVFAGERLARDRRDAAGISVMAAALVVAGLLMSVWMPVNKQLWTPSYAVLTAGIALFSLTACLWLVDIRGLRRWAVPFIALGTNSLAVFFASSLVARITVFVTVPDGGGHIPLKLFIHRTLFASWLSPEAASLAYSLMVLAFWTAAAWVLYRRKIFIRI